MIFPYRPRRESISAMTALLAVSVYSTSGSADTFCPWRASGAANAPVACPNYNGTGKTLSIPPTVHGYPAGQSAPKSGYQSNPAVVYPLPPLSPKMKGYASAQLAMNYGNLIDLFYPAQAPSTPPPLIILIHGGGWSANDRTALYAQGQSFANLGYAAASIDYRLDGVAAFPAALEDVRCAIRTLRYHVQTTSYASGVTVKAYDPSRVAMYGDSAGGNLAAMAGVMANLDPNLYGADDQPLDDPKCPVAPSEASAVIQMVIDVYGNNSVPSSLNTYGDDWISTVNPAGSKDPDGNLCPLTSGYCGTSGYDAHNLPFSQAGDGNLATVQDIVKYFGKNKNPYGRYNTAEIKNDLSAILTYYASNEIVATMFPFYHIQLNRLSPGQMPPFFVANGAADGTVPPAESIEFWNEISGAAPLSTTELTTRTRYSGLTSAAGSHQYWLIPAVGHDWTPFGWKYVNGGGLSSTLPDTTNTSGCYPLNESIINGYAVPMTCAMVNAMAKQLSLGH